MQCCWQIGIRISILLSVPSLLPQDEENAELLHIQRRTDALSEEQQAIDRRWYAGVCPCCRYCYRDKTVPTVNLNSIFCGLTCCFRDRFKGNHYKEKLAKFSKESGIALNHKGLLDVLVIDTSEELAPEVPPTEASGAIQNIKNGKTSPNAFIYTSDIIVNGEIFPKSYKINITCTQNPSVGQTAKSLSVHKNHRMERATIIPKIRSKCRLFREFENGTRRLHHEELFGLLTTMINIETGDTLFIQTLRNFSNLYENRADIWERHRQNVLAYGYQPTRCQNFCPYRNQCEHSRNILLTAHPKRGTMERIVGYQPNLQSLEHVQKDVYRAINHAFQEDDKDIHVIKAQTAAGKTTCYIKLMEEHEGCRFLIAAPTNLLKHEIYEAAKRVGVNICMTPSLDEIANKLPAKVWERIQMLYRTGQHNAVHSYIEELLPAEDIPCLEKYMAKRKNLKQFKGCVVTTHRYLMSMEEKRLIDFNSIIIDEDILFKSVISNQGEITVSDLEKVYSTTTSISLQEKIHSLLHLSKKQTCIHVKSVTWDNEEYDPDFPATFDAGAFCAAEKFYFRSVKNEEKLEEDTFAFLKPAQFPNVKFIMVSATADKAVCRLFFQDRELHFYECANAAYIGDLLQYPQKSMSRISLDNNKGIILRLMKRFGIAESNVITFMKENIGYLHFGNTEGSNTLQGQNILVVGTPFHAIFLYKLVAFFMDITFDEEEEMTLQTVTHNGYLFQFNTFRNLDLRAIQFWMLESELEQAVGRARLLRNKCKVHLFSNFPLQQAKMVDDFVDIKD